jgi:Protein of unknown function (DUF2380)
MRTALSGLALLAVMQIASPATAVALAVMPLKLLDTSGEPVDQASEHAARLRTMEEALQRDLGADYDEVVLIGEDELAAGCPEESPQCLVDLAAGAGADEALFAVVLKTSTLIMQMFVSIVDVEGGQVVKHRELNFRGDTDESWQRAEQFLVENLRAP